MPRLAYEFSRHDLEQMYLPIIVEGYKHKNYGRGKRAYLKEFTEKERKAISKYHAKIYKWYLVTGFPDHYIFRKLQTVHLLQRAVIFFASI